MQIIHITPVADLDLITTQPMQMLLTHLVEKSDTYRKWAKSLSGYKILDNSLIELGAAVQMDRVLTSAYEVQAQEIILPDVFLNGPETVRAVETGLKYIEGSHKDFKVMAVCQGKDKDEFIQCFDRLNSMSEIDVIGIPKVCAKLSPAGRPAFEFLWNDSYIAGHNTVKYCDKEIHLLGCWYSWEELFRFDNPSRIRSIDSLLACYLAKWGLSFNSMRPDGHTLDLEKDSVGFVGRSKIVLLDKVGA